MRGAYGQSGIQPGSTTALQTFSTSTVHVGDNDQSALAANNIGNAKLKPELTLEYEGGFDLRVLRNRVNLELTYYSKQTKDALENYSYAPSAAASSTITRNLGGVKNAGVEASITTTLIDRRNFSWDVTIGGSHNKNKVTYLGFDDAGVELPATPRTSTSRTIAGYPLGSIWLRNYTYSDKNKDGLITPDEVVADDITKGDSAQYVGPAFPTDLANVTTGFDLFQRKLRLNITANYSGGFTKNNNTQSFLCAQTVACFATQNPAAPLWDQARQVAADVILPATLRTASRLLRESQFLAPARSDGHLHAARRHWTPPPPLHRLERGRRRSQPACVVALHRRRSRGELQHRQLAERSAHRGPADDLHVPSESQVLTAAEDDNS